MTYYNKIYVIAQQDVDGYIKLLDRERLSLTGYAWTENIKLAIHFGNKTTAKLCLEKLIKEGYIPNDCFIKEVEIRYRW